MDANVSSPFTGMAGKRLSATACNILRGSPLVVIGHYSGTRGGCDTIRAVDGGLAEAVRSAAAFTSSGCNVILEGLELSSDTDHTLPLSQKHPLHVLQLSTPASHCVRNLVRRRRPRRDMAAGIETAVATDLERIDEACRVLSRHANVKKVSLDKAQAEAETLLGLSKAASPNELQI